MIDLQADDFKTPDFSVSGRKTLFSRLGQYIFTRTKELTQTGRDYEGVKFQKYSEPYLAEKTAGGGIALVNLVSVKSDIGHMMQTLGIKELDAEHVEVGVNPDQQYKVIANENTKNRVFLGIGEKLEKELDKIGDAWLEEELQK